MASNKTSRHLKEKGPGTKLQVELLEVNVAPILLSVHNTASDRDGREVVGRKRKKERRRKQNPVRKAKGGLAIINSRNHASA